MKKSFKYTIIGIASFFLILFGFYLLLIWAKQGVYLKYDNGVTIEVNNSSKHAITDLNFYFSLNGNRIYQDLGNINSLEPGETTSLYSQHINGTGNDRSLYLQYPINKTDTEAESLAYLPSYKASKVVVILEITGTDNKGKILFRGKGYEDVFGQFNFDFTSIKE